jgi:trk system potassium uptake protein TrkH
MFIAGTNYFVIYHLAKGNFKTSWQNEEFRWYFFVVLLLIVFITFGILLNDNIGFEKSFRASAFMVLSMVTTTGFVTADYTSWSDAITSIFFLLLFLGGCAGSTAGGIKLIRHLVFAKNSLLEFKRILHPRAIIRIKINKELVAPRILTHILVFLLIYLLTFVLGTIVVIFMGMDLLSAAGAVATSLGNVGPGIGTVGPINNFFAVPESAKWVLSVLMIMGRLELFTVIVLFTPYFWKTN